MPYSKLYALLALLAVTGIFLISLRKRGLKIALFLSIIGLAAFAAIFFIFLTVALNNM